MSRYDRLAAKLDAGLPATVPFFSKTERDRLQTYAYLWAKRAGTHVSARTAGDHLHVTACKPEPRYVGPLNSAPDSVARDVAQMLAIIRVELRGAAQERESA